LVEYSIQFFFSSNKHTIAPKQGGLKPLYHSVGAFATGSPEENALNLLRNHEDLISNYAEKSVALIVLEIKKKTGVETKIGRGTGFYVAPQVIATAFHVFERRVQSFDPICSLDYQLPELPHIGDQPRVNSILISDATHTSMESHDKECQQDDADPSSAVARIRLATQNDFNFAHIDFGSIAVPVDTPYFIPFDGDVHPTTPIAVMGYVGSAPSRLTLEKRAKSYYTRNDISPKQLESVFYQEFNKRHVSVGCVTSVDEAFKRVFAHNCSTLTGQSGSPIILLEHPGTFCGIQIEAWTSKNYNLAVSVHNPNFVIQYALHVVPKLTSIPDGVRRYLCRHKAILTAVSGLPASVKGVLV